MKRTFLVLSASFLLACGGSTRHDTRPPGGASDPGGPGGSASDPELAARMQFDNPGGMWMPRQMPGHAELLSGLGLELDAAALSDPTRFPLAAVVSLGGCTASFVSPEGLMVTNHHCVQSALQHNSTPEDNLVENGFLARTRADERSAGPSQRVWVAHKITDVTAPMVEGLAAIDAAAQRQEKLEQRQKEQIAACEKDRPGTRCKVASFFDGLEWQLVEYLELRDVRLVYVPHRGIGNFGGEIDNWAWPRHTGDFAFYRAYVGKDGKPADYSPDNVPFQPAAHLKVQPAGVSAHDLVFVTGYPGRTNRHQLAMEMRRSIEWTHPRAIEKGQQKMEILAELQAQPGETAIKAGVYRQGVQNGLEKSQGILDGLSGSDLIQRKEADEKAFRAWAAEDPSRARYAQALASIEGKLAEIYETATAEAAWNDAVGGSSLLSQAIFFVRWSHEQQKPDGERKLGLQERDRSMIVASQKAFAKRFDRTIDRAMWKLMLVRAAKADDADSWLPGLLGLPKNARVDGPAIDKALDRFYGKTKLEDEKVRMALLTAKPKQLEKSKDPFIQLAVNLYPRLEQMEKRDDAWYGELIVLEPIHAEGLLAFKGGMVAPDANGTLRISFGTVRGYRPSADKPVYAPFTSVTDIPAKDTGKDPFDSPKNLLSAIAAGNWGPYASPQVGAVPVDFLSDLDITGGNSGSPVLNAKGELVGLAFDGNYEGLASDVVFKGETTRTITTDIRYLLWVADAVDRADHLLEEMGITPAL